MATAQQLAELDAWLDQYGAAVARADAGTVAATWAAYAVVDDWFDPAQTLTAATTAAAAAEAARSTQAGLIGEFLAFTLELITGQRSRPLRVVPDYGRAAEPFQVYSRPVHEYRDAITIRGLDEAAALAEAEYRAEVLSLTDALLARRDAGAAAMEDAGVSHYRRVIRPELSATGTCGLCIAAATRIYSIEELLPIHSRCKCVTMPILGGVDPGDINATDLERLYESIPATRRQELARFRYQVTDSGELGPVLEPAA